MRKILVLGLGNEILGDDAVGILCAREIKKIFSDKIDVIETSESGLRIIDYLLNYNKVLILDSTFVGENKVGEIREYVFDKDFKSFSLPSPHYVSISTAIKIAQILELNPALEIKILAMGIDKVLTIGSKLSNRVKDSFDEYVARAKKILENWLSEIN